MGNVKVNEDMLVLISDLTNLEQNKLMLMATIYTRKIEELKKNKIDNLQVNEIFFASICAIVWAVNICLD